MLLFVVTALVFAASGIVAARLYPATSAPESVAERGLCTALVATAILEGDIYALGWSGQLDRLTMVLVALAASAVLAALSAATAPSRTALLRDAV
ncbi:MAG: hypothetical protein ACK5U8_26755, partial [Deltaproteobacteria bacterium]